MLPFVRPFSNLMWIILLFIAQILLVVGAQQPIQSSTVMEVALAPENSMLTITCPQTCSLRLYDATYKQLCLLGIDLDCSNTCLNALNAMSMVSSTCSAQPANQCMVEVSSKTLRRPCSPQQAKVVHLVVSYRCEDCTPEDTQPVRVAVEPVVYTFAAPGASSGSGAAYGAGGNVRPMSTLTLGSSGTVRPFCDLSQLAFVRALCNSNGKLTLP